MGHMSPRQWRSRTTKRQPRRIGRLFTLALLLASSVLMGAVPAHAGTTLSDYGYGSCVDDDHWAKAKTDPNWTCEINIEGFGLGGVSKQTLDYADHHILIAKDGAADPCSVDNKKGKLPTSTPKFCFKVGNEVRGVWTWSNSKSLGTPKPPQGSLSWLDSVEKIGSRSESGGCDSELTKGKRCPNQLGSGINAFRGMGGEGGPGIRNLDTSNLISMQAMFYASGNFNDDIRSWKTGAVEDMSYMFYEATAFNQGISGWDTSSVGNMSLMFLGAEAFNHDIGGWNTSQVRIMSGMFTDAAAFNQDIGGWATTRVLNMDYMFASFDVPTSFNQDLSAWDVRLIEGEPELFREGTAATWAGIAGTTWCNEGQPQWGTDGTSGCSTAQGPDEIIEAIMGGGMVKGTECVNGKVDPEAIKIETDAMSYGPDQTLYVYNGSAVNLRAADDYAFRAGDEVFSRVIGGGKEGNSLTYNCQYETTSIGQFGTAGTSICTGGSLPLGPGKGSHVLVFRSENGTEVVLGRLYETTLNYPNYYCSPPGLLPPDKPQMRGAAPHASGGMLVEFDQTGPGGDPDYYLYEMQHEGGVATRQGRVVDEQDNDDTSSPFVITPEAALSLTPGQWKVRIQAWNAAGESPWSDYSDLMNPSVEEPPVPDAPVITGVTTSNRKATISFIAPEDYGEAITNYAYRLTGKFDDPELFETLNPPIVKSPITVAGLVNGKTYTVSIAAINANGTGPDSNEEEFTVGTECDAVTDWTAPANTMGYFCSIGLNDYAYADFHILTTDGTGVCDARDTYLPTGENNNQGLFCSHTDTQLRAIFNWNNGSRNKKLTWLVKVEQIGSRTKADKNCGVAGETVSRRCANQITNGQYAFKYMAGVGGSGIANLDISNLSSLFGMFDGAPNFNENIGGWDTSNVTDMWGMFRDARAFDQDIGGWDVSKVVNMNVAFQDARAFNANLEAWDVLQVANFDDMFDGAIALETCPSWAPAEASCVGPP